jgi:acyl-CoA reductase-like NAD-dependent aldehyde dehydrogenase
MNARVAVHRTCKLFIGGKFPRSEGGHVLAANSPKGTLLANVCRATRKDLRDAVVSARAAFGAWAAATPYLRGQILHRAAELVEHRLPELASDIARSTGANAATARREVAACADRLVHYAGWTDKVASVFGSVNPVATPHFNFTFPEPTGVVVVFAPDSPSLLGLVSVLAPVLVPGNTAVVIASERYPLPSVTFAEILATSDVPGGVVNVLTGMRAELAPHAAGHLDVNAIVDGAGDAELSRVLRDGVGSNLKRYARRAPARGDWLRGGEDARWILDTIEWKTAWHPIGM